MFCEIVVGEVIGASSPTNQILLTLFYPILNPIKTHFDCFRSTLFYRFAGDACGTCVRCLFGLEFGLVDGPFISMQYGSECCRVRCRTKLPVRPLLRTP
jgi:hypothetical protein